MTHWLEPFRQAVRSATRHPLYSTFTVLALAVAIGGGTLFFSLYDAIAFRALPVARPDQLVSVRDLNVGDDGQTADFGRFSLAEFEEMRDAAANMAVLSAFASGESVVRAGGRTEHDEVQWVDPGYFQTLGVLPVQGRLFVAGDDPRHGGDGGVVITDATWARLFGHDPNVAGRTVDLDGVPTPILGVVPAAFQGFEVGEEPALFGLASAAPPDWAFFRMFGRVRPGVSRVALEAKLASVHEAIRARGPKRQSFMIIDGKSSRATERIEVADGSRGESELRTTAKLPLALVGALLALVLLVLAANLANLLAVRALSERGAAAIRMALGAPRSLIVWGWFMQSLILTIVGAALGLAAVAIDGTAFLNLAPLPPWVHGLAPAVDGKTVLLALGLSVLIALMVGGLAAWEQSRVTPGIRLRQESGSSTTTRAGIRWRNALIASQVAFSVILLVAMGLFVRSAASLLDIDTGFPLAHVLTFRLDLPETQAAKAPLPSLRETLAHMPGVVDAGFSTNPVLGGVRAYVMASIEGYQPKPGEVLMLNNLAVSPGFFDALEMPLASGRFFSPTDGVAGHPAVINRQFADHYFKGVDPIGRRLSFNFKRSDWSVPDADDLTVVGVVDDRMVSDVREQPTPRLYSLADGHPASLNFYVRTIGRPSGLGPAIERLVRERVPNGAVGFVHTLEDQRNRSLRRELLMRDLTLVFGALATALAALGLFAVLSYVVGERRREIGLRHALGATPGALLRRVMADGLRPVLWGLAMGLIVAALSSRLAASQLYEVTARDPLAFIAALVIMLVVGAAACFIPALRASRIDPAKALHTE